MSEPSHTKFPVVSCDDNEPKDAKKGASASKDILSWIKQAVIEGVKQSTNPKRPSTSTSKDLHEFSSSSSIREVLEVLSSLEDDDESCGFDLLNRPCLSRIQLHPVH